MTYDAIVVGARCAGSPTAMLLARRGHRVLLLDRAAFPSDTLSTHFLQTRGASYLNRWGLLERVLAAAPAWHRFTLTREGRSITGAPPLAALRGRLAALTRGDGSEATLTWCAPRRTFLDTLLADAAADAGAELRLGVACDDVVVEDGRVAGVRTRDLATGRTGVERAAIVVGADGKHSRLARRFAVPTYAARERCTFAYWSYWSGLSLEGLRWPMHLRGRLGVAAFPTNDGLVQVLVMGPDEWGRSFRADVERNHLLAVELVVPELAELLRAQGRREERFHGTLEQPNVFRRPYGPGFALVGDAGFTKDQVTAIGMTHAFRDAELLAGAIHEWLAGRASFEAALGRYHRLRDEDSRAYYELVCDVAEMRPATPGELEQLEAMASDQAAVDAFLAVFQDVVPPPATTPPPAGYAAVPNPFETREAVRGPS